MKQTNEQCFNCEHWHDLTTSLQAELNAARAALEYYKNKCHWCGGRGVLGRGMAGGGEVPDRECGFCKIARAALPQPEVCGTCNDEGYEYTQGKDAIFIHTDKPCPDCQGKEAE